MADRRVWPTCDVCGLCHRPVPGESVAGFVTIEVDHDPNALPRWVQRSTAPDPNRRYHR